MITRLWRGSNHQLRDVNVVWVFATGPLIGGTRTGVDRSRVVTKNTLRSLATLYAAPLQAMLTNVVVIAFHLKIPWMKPAWSMTGASNITARVLGGVSQLETRASATLLSFGKHTGTYIVARLRAANGTPIKFS